MNNKRKWSANRVFTWPQRGHRKNDVPKYSRTDITSLRRRDNHIKDSGRLNLYKQKQIILVMRSDLKFTRTRPRISDRKDPLVTFEYLECWTWNKKYILRALWLRSFKNEVISIWLWKWLILRLIFKISQLYRFILISVVVDVLS